MSIQERQYQEARSALNWSLLAFGLIIPVGAEMLLLILAIAALLAVGYLYSNDRKR